MISTTKVECDGPDCPMCAVLGKPKKVYPVKAIIDGEVVQMQMSEGNYQQALGRIYRQTKWWWKAWSWLKQIFRR